MMITNLVASIVLSLVTNAITLVTLPAGPCYDIGVMGASFDTRDPRPVYGLRIDVLDARNNVIAGGWVQECYVPPVTETVAALLSPDAVAVRCEIFGPDLDGKWSDAYFMIVVRRAKLEISVGGGGIRLNWFDPGECWHLESKSEGAWLPAERSMPATNRMALFRLKRG